MFNRQQTQSNVKLYVYEMIGKMVDLMLPFCDSMNKKSQGNRGVRKSIRNHKKGDRTADKFGEMAAQRQEGNNMQFQS
jgi:hypothetical protein